MTPQERRRGDLILKRYRITEAGGETALYIAYRATDEQARGGEADVLVKLVRPELAHDEPSRTYVLRELSRVRLLLHPGIIRPAEIHSAEEEGGVVLVEPMPAGLSQGLLLSRMVYYRQKEGDRFPLEEVRRIGVQLASALSYAHSQLLCHGDLRLESVLLKPEGVRLCDVGLGRALPRGPYLLAIEKSGEQDLLAPEVRTGRPPDVKADVYGLAAIYRHLLTFAEAAAWDGFLAENPILGAVLRRGLHDDPQLRYPSVEAMVADIESVALTGAPLRRRQSPTPLAMAVAAGRLPMEELDRPVEDLVPERRRRRDSVELDGTVLAPLSTSPSARASIGTIPPKMSRSGTTLPPEGEAGDGGRAERAAVPVTDARSGAVPPSAKSGAVPASERSTKSGAVPASARSTKSGAVPASARSTKSGAVSGVPAVPAATAPSGVAASAVPPPAATAKSGAVPAGARSGAVSASSGTPVRPLRAGPSSTLTAGSPPASAQAPEIDQVPTRPVRRSDLEELRRSASYPALSAGDIGAQHTVPFDRLDPSHPALPGPRPPAGDPEAIEYTEEQERLDPADLRASFPPRAPLPPTLDEDHSGLRTRQRARPDPDDLPTGNHRHPDRPFGVPTRGTLRSGPLTFEELPPLLPLSGGPPSSPERSRIERDGPPSPTPSTPRLLRRTPGDPSSAGAPSVPGLEIAERPAAGSTDRLAQPTPTRPTPTRPTVTPTRKITAPGERLVVVFALVLSTLVGALAAALVFTLFRAHDRGRARPPHPPAPTEVPRPASSEAGPPPAPGPGATPAAATPTAPAAPAAAAPALTASLAAPAAPTAAPAAPGHAAAAGACPAGMVRVGSRQPYCIDQHESPGPGQRPRTDLSAAEAEALCQMRGGRLCSEAEWELACRGKGAASYPWGHDPRQPACNLRGGALEAAGSHRQCLSASGAFDMAGNAAEWVRGGGVRGGSAAGESDGRCSVRGKAPPGGRGPFLGYRCCK